MLCSLFIMPIEPHLYRLAKDSIMNNGVYAVNFVRGQEKKAMEIVKTEFRNFFPNDAFEFRNMQFLTQNENALKAWKGFSKIMTLTAIITIIISSIGLIRTDPVPYTAKDEGSRHPESTRIFLMAACI